MHALFAVISLFAMVNLARAEEAELNKYRFEIGGYTVGRYSSNISLTEPNLGTGISISPEDTLGIDTETTVLRIQGYYRFRPKHALTYGWYSINSNGNQIIDEEFEWTDPG